jgi:hypothetical protein
LTQAIIQLAKKDMNDNGKSGQTVNVIQKVVKASKEGDDQKLQGSTNKPNIPTSPVLIPLTPTPGPTRTSTSSSPQPQLGPLDMLLVHGGRYIIDYALGPGTAARIDKFAEHVIAASPLISKVFALLTATDISLRTVNNAGPSQAIQTLNALFNTKSDAHILQRVGQVAELYQRGDDISAAHTTDVVSNKLVAGIDPALAIEETPIPEPEITFVTTGEAEPLSSGELHVKSLPPSEGRTTIPAGNGSQGIGEPERPVQPLLLPEATEPGESAFIPGLGLLAPQPVSPIPSPDTTTLDGRPEAITTPEAEPPMPLDTEDRSTDVVVPELPSEQPFIQEPSGPEVSPFISEFGPSSLPPLFQERITSLPPEEKVVEDQSEVNTVPPLTASTSNLCQISPGLCQQQEYPPQLPPVNICQEQTDLPQCIQADNNLGEDTAIEYSYVPENAVLSYSDEDIGGYQQEEVDYSEEDGEEDDYEEVGGYNAAEEDYSEEEDSGDEEDDYEEVGEYQEEEEQYNEEDNEEEEDFSEEEEESGEYYEE